MKSKREKRDVAFRFPTRNGNREANKGLRYRWDGIRPLGIYEEVYEMVNLKHLRGDEREAAYQKWLMAFRDGRKVIWRDVWRVGLRYKIDVSRFRKNKDRLFGRLFIEVGIFKRWWTMWEDDLEAWWEVGDEIVKHIREIKI